MKFRDFLEYDREDYTKIITKIDNFTEKLKLKYSGKAFEQTYKDAIISKVCDILIYEIRETINRNVNNKSYNYKKFFKNINKKIKDIAEDDKERKSFIEELNLDYFLQEVKNDLDSI